MMARGRTPPATRTAGRLCARYTRLLACLLAVGRVGGWHAGGVGLVTRLNAPRSAVCLRADLGEGAAGQPIEIKSEAAPAEEGRRAASGRRSSVARKPAGERVVDVLSEPCNVVLTHTNADFDSLAGVRSLSHTALTRAPTHIPC